MWSVLITESFLVKLEVLFDILADIRTTIQFQSLDLFEKFAIFKLRKQR